jgi:hypothetical protein
MDSPPRTTPGQSAPSKTPSKSCAQPLQICDSASIMNASVQIGHRAASTSCTPRLPMPSPPSGSPRGRRITCRGRAPDRREPTAVVAKVVPVRTAVIRTRPALWRLLGAVLLVLGAFAAGGIIATYAPQPVRHQTQLSRIPDPAVGYGNHQEGTELCRHCLREPRASWWRRWFR